ncbi:MAG: hypothetical protein KDC49_20035 [Saprospiraceae bacterium]|nr:hypothetical protein [Saprospiraceae bacterium]
MDPVFTIIVNFTTSIGVEVASTSLFSEPTFLPGIKIDEGKIKIDPEKLTYIGDLLHEVGHIAVSDEHERNSLNEEKINSSKMREAEEMMAIAWSYAACLHLNIDPKIVFHKDGYQGGGDVIVENFNEGRYFGVPMLAYYGMTIEPKPKEKISDFHFPKMIRWLR